MCGYRDPRGAHLEILYFVGLFATTSYCFISERLIPIF
jgi:hypothetical protein